MHGFKMYSTVLTIVTFDTLYSSISMHLTIMVKQFNKIQGTNTKLEFVGCVKEQIDLVQSGFGCYLLCQFTFLTFNFILQSYDFLIQWMVDSSNSSKTEFICRQVGLLTIILANLLKMVMIAIAAGWLVAATNGIRTSLVDERQLCKNEEYVKVRLFDQIL